MRAGGFVGRERESAVLEGVLARDATRPIVFVHGPGGIGKSALISETVRRAHDRGMTVVSVDGRDPSLALERIVATFGQLSQKPAADGALLVVDTYEEAPALGPLLREEMPAALDHGLRMIVAGRRPPESAWGGGDWPDLLLEMKLGPMVTDDVHRLLETRGVDQDRIGTVADWSEGHPLSLTIAADAVASGATLDVRGLDSDEELASTLIRRLARDELDGTDQDVLAVAAFSRAVDARLLGAVVPEVDGDHAETWLRSLSFSEPLGPRVTLHARMRVALSTTLEAQDPDYSRELRRRIVDHGYARIVLGERHMLADVAEQITDPALRWGLAPVRMTHRTTGPRPGDREQIGEMLGVVGEDWWEVGTRRWFDEAPERVAVVRDTEGEISAWGITLTPATAPPWAEEDPVVASWLEDAREAHPEGNVFMGRDGTPLPLTDEPVTVSEAVSSSNFHLILATGLPTVDRNYAALKAGDEQGRAFLLAMGYQHMPHLDCDEPGHETSTFVADWGPGGVFRAGRDLVYASLGIAPPAATDESGGSEDTAAAVRDALRSFHDPLALSSSSLAHGATTDQRAEMVRSLLRRSTAAAFGESDDEQLQRATIERGYLDPEGGHSRAIAELHVSRATYYRRLAEAAERLGTYVALESPGVSGADAQLRP